MAGATSPGSLTPCRSTQQAPSENRDATSPATSTASRVLPQPPEPVNVTTRASVTRSATFARSRSRPTNAATPTGSPLCISMDHPAPIDEPTADAWPVALASDSSWTTFPNRRANAGPDQTHLDFRSSSGRCASSRHLAEGHPQVLIIAPGVRSPSDRAHGQPESGQAATLRRLCPCLGPVDAFLCTHEPLPEICQKLRYTQPHVALPPDPQQRLSPVWLCGHVRCCRAL